MCLLEMFKLSKRLIISEGFPVFRCVELLGELRELHERIIEVFLLVLRCFLQGFMSMLAA